MVLVWLALIIFLFNAAGCSTFLIDYGYGERAPAGPFRRVSSLREAADAIMNDKGEA